MPCHDSKTPKWAPTLGGMQTPVYLRLHTTTPLSDSKHIPKRGYNASLVLGTAKFNGFFFLFFETALLSHMLFHSFTVTIRSRRVLTRLPTVNLLHVTRGGRKKSPLLTAIIEEGGEHQRKKGIAATEYNLAGKDGER